MRSCTLVIPRTGSDIHAIWEGSLVDPVFVPSPRMAFPKGLAATRHNAKAWGIALIVPHIFVDTSESDSVLNNSLVPNSLVTKHSFVLAHLQTRRPLRSVLHFGHGRKWHEIGQSNYGQANESQEHRWLKNHRNPIYDRSIFRLRCVVR